MSNIWHDISPKRISPEDFICVIEISKGSKKKYELDKETGLIMLDRILYTSTHYPANYGFIPRTYGDDGDPLDVLLICAEKLEPMSLVRAYPIGVISMVDNGNYDEKIIAIPFNDPNYNMYKSIDQLPTHLFDEMRHFFKVYKNLEDWSLFVITSAKNFERQFGKRADRERKLFNSNKECRYYYYYANKTGDKK